MARMLNVKFKVHEKHAIDCAWRVLDDIACRNGSSASGALNETLRHETTGSHAVPRLVAIGFISDWFSRYARFGTPPLRDFLGTRSVNIGMFADYAMHNIGKEPTQAELDCIRAAAQFKDIAIERDRAATA